MNIITINRANLKQVATIASTSVLDSFGDVFGDELGKNKKVKVVFFIAHHPRMIVIMRGLDCLKLHKATLFALPDILVHSDTNSASPGSILDRQQICAKTKSLTFPPLSKPGTHL